MTLLALEINDTGIMAAVGQPPRLLPVDGDRLQSPGIAVVDRRRLLVGHAARQRAHLSPRFTFDAFWDHLSTEPLPRRVPRIRSHAEMAYRHLEQIWQQVRPGVDEVVMAVPPHFDRNAMGIILSIARELGMPLRGFAATAVAAADHAPGTDRLLHMDLHLHRLEITRLAVDRRISLEEPRWLEEKGRLHLHHRWAEALAAEFVQTTRFDPLHRAATEQELYDRLPGLLADVEKQGSALFEMRSGTAVYRITVTRDLLAAAVDAVFAEIPRLVDQVRAAAPVTVQYTHRLAALPGFESLLAGMPAVRPVALAPGAAALGAAGMWQELEDARGDARALYFTSRPCPQPPPASNPQDAATPPKPPPATHVLYEHIAYPLSATPLVVGTHPPKGGLALPKEDGIQPRHCSLRLEGGGVRVEVHGDAEIRVDGRPIDAAQRLAPGHTLQLGRSGVQLRLITCLNGHET